MKFQCFRRVFCYGKNFNKKIGAAILNSTHYFRDLLYPNQCLLQFVVN